MADFIEVAMNAMDSASIAIDRGNFERGKLNIDLAVACALIAIAKELRAANSTHNNTQSTLGRIANALMDYYGTELTDETEGNK